MPGMDGTGLLFRPLLKEFPPDIEARVISYPCDTKLSYSQLVKYVRRRLPENKAFVLVAESFSGPIGYALASSNPPSNLQAAVFVSTFISPPKSWLWRIPPFLLVLLLKLPLPSSVLKRFLFGKDVENQTVDLFKKAQKMVRSSMLAYRIRETSRLEGGEKQIDIPCRYIVGGKDRLVSPIHFEEFRRLAPGIKLTEIPGPHFIMQAKPKECAQIIQGYIKR
ncbi:MAG: alpha/beta fold hydrolase [Candidatus Electrothrix sp. YB6]